VYTLKKPLVLSPSFSLSQSSFSLSPADLRVTGFLSNTVELSRSPHPGSISASSPLSSAFSLSATAVAERSTATWTIARWWYLANATCLPACPLPGERQCQSVLRYWPNGRSSGCDQPEQSIYIYPSLPLLSLSLSLFLCSSPVHLSFPLSSLFYAPGTPAHVPLVPPRSRPDVWPGQQEGPQVLRHRDVALHRRRGHGHVFLQVSFRFVSLRHEFDVKSVASLYLAYIVNVRHGDAGGWRCSIAIAFSFLWT